MKKMYALFLVLFFCSIASFATEAETKTWVCTPTVQQTEGPFYPTPTDWMSEDTDNDLTQVKGKSQRVRDKHIRITGVVMNEECQEIQNAVIKIWQAGTSGSYLHSRDSNPAPIDPNFQYWGQAVMGSDAWWSFTTIKPGVYPASPTWDRAPHIHVKVEASGYETLTTQFYFKEDIDLLKKDLIIQNLTQEQRKSVILRLRYSHPSSLLTSTPYYLFAITLKKSK